ncbi:Ribonuclease H-like superfamily [Sesbania bispinosa]|nr:Ribonuclease H-like superfamily [Sesbania bispinosa]
MKFRVCAQLRSGLQALSSDRNPNLNIDPFSRSISWSPPQHGWFTLNTDGAVSSENGAACGGAFRYCWSRFILGFSGNLGTCSVLHAELWGILRGLIIASQRGFS